MPADAAAPPSPDLLERARLITVLLTVGASVAGSAYFSTQPWSDGRTAVALNAANALLFGAHLLRHRGDPPLVRLLLFGFALGSVELLADWLCVRFTGTLDYAPAKSLLLFVSPWWMPLAWMMVGAQVGYLGARFVERVGLLPGALLSTLCGACLIPFYEEMAYHAHWWCYMNCRMVGHTPLYIIAAEAVIGLALGPLARIALREPSWSRAILAGALAGLSTIVGGLFGYGLMERLL